MKQMFSVSLVLCTAVTVFAQNDKKDVVKREATTVTTTTTTVADSSYDLLGLETFNFLDATTFTEGAVDLRLAGRWIDSGNSDDADDQIILTPEIVWGASEKYELFLAVPTWVDGEPYEGNYDAYVGGQWRVTDLDGDWGAVALAWSIRVPTGEGSNGVDASLRAIVTHEYDSGIRSHFNIWGTTVNTDNYDARNFQYGAVVGLDGPLCDDGAVRWVFDYMYESSHAEGSEPDMLYYAAGPDPETGGEQRNTAELGVQWQINETSKLGFGFQAGLDHAENETPELAASLTYAYTIAN
jgi:hypothetical protein